MSLSFTPKLAPYFAVAQADELVRFLVEGLGGELRTATRTPEGRLAHAEVRLDDSVVMVAELPEGRPPFPSRLHLYVPDSDAAYARALRAGAVSVRPPGDSDDGMRRGGVRDPWGNEWWFSHVRRPV